jgi:hypothetical protein
LDVSKDQEVAVEWSSVVLIAARMIVQNHTVPETFRAASACTQADDERIAELAGKLWPPRERRGTTPSTSRNSFVRCSDVGSP